MNIKDNFILKWMRTGRFPIDSRELGNIWLVVKNLEKWESLTMSWSSSCRGDLELKGSINLFDSEKNMEESVRYILEKENEINRIKIKILEKLIEYRKRLATGGFLMLSTTRNASSTKVVKAVIIISIYSLNPYKDEGVDTEDTAFFSDLIEGYSECRRIYKNIRR